MYNKIELRIIFFKIKIIYPNKDYINDNNCCNEHRLEENKELCIK